MTTSIGCIGCGNMGAAIMRGLAERTDLQLLGTDVDFSKASKLGDELGMQAVELKDVVDKADYLLLAVKPNQVAALLGEIKARLQPNQILISIAAGMTLKSLKLHASGACPVIRVMPNTPAMVQAGVFALCFDDPALKEEPKSFVRELFTGLGQVHVLKEQYFDAFTALTGSGPAYVFYFMEAIVEAGVSMGLTRAQSTEMVKGLFTGSTKLAVESEHHLSILREMVTSPAGSTIEATMHFDRNGLRGLIIDAVRASCKRSSELGD